MIKRLHAGIKAPGEMASIILGPQGQPIEQAELTGPARAVAGASLSAHSEDEATGLTPIKLAALLKETEEGDPARYFALAERMEERWAHYAAVLGVRKRQVSQLPMSVEAFDDSAAADADAQLVRDFLQEPLLADALFDVLDAVGKGVSVTEVIWETSERAWQPVGMKWVDPRWLRYDFLTLRHAVLDQPPYDQKMHGPRWMVHTVRNKSGIPSRTGLARLAAWYWLFAAFDIHGWVNFAEAYGQPIRLGKFPQAASATERLALLNALRQIGENTAVAIPDSMSYELITDASRSTNPQVHERLIRYLEQSISKLVLGQTMTTDAGASLAQAKVHDEVRADVERADARSLSATLTRCIAQPLVAFNRGVRKHYPKIVIERADTADLPHLISAIRDLAPLGLQVSMQALRQRLGLPAPINDNDQFDEGNAHTQTLAYTQADRQQHLGADSADHELQMEPADADWEQVMTPVIEPVLASAQDADSTKTLAQRLAAAGLKMDHKVLQKTLKEAGFAAQLSDTDGDAPD